MEFQILSDITEIETIAIGHGIRELDRLQKIYGNRIGANRRQPQGPLLS